MKREAKVAMKSAKIPSTTTVGEVKKMVKHLANTPKPEDISSPRSQRSQYSVKHKRRLARHAIRHNLPNKSVAVMAGVSVAQVYAWKRDYLNGKLTLRNSVAVCRS